ncbi:phosphatidate cytidylyltransferase [Azotobacter beijerinckii]|uniref:Phosphatidate cytidylyltransferase n=1 Tax=Azotobacter beijerinckii TaxID=170623 RepID=A0A1H6QTS1_9GAMM|nr:phosphatidate cytidylyltransferase [Azotobacter beijerinckii]SEI42372.1 phosphatidate cytidylyltransferase [Azotobacter beijerinckii]
MLKQRILTALVLLPLALAGFFLLEGVAFALFIGAVVTLGGWEWARLAGFAGQSARLGFAASVAALLVLLYWVPVLAAGVMLLGILWWLLAVPLVLNYPQSAPCWEGAGRRLAIGLLILLPAWQGLLLLKQWPLGNQLILAVMVLVWTADIGAYFVGRAFGRRKLAPQVSPGKSWEGVAGGLLACLLLTVAVGLVRGWSVGEQVLALAGAALVVLISVVGDLTESMFKRQAGLKDSSHLLPGHGGVLDRIDSLTAAIPMFVVMLWLAGWRSF